jgi:GNAT superfamily N-acetyltransferase
MEMAELRWRAEENMREAFRVMARYAADGAVLEVENACHIATGIPNAFFNPVFLHRIPDDLEGFRRRAQAFYEARGGLPWTLILPRYEDEPPLLTTDRLRDAGMIPAGFVPMLLRPTPRNESWPRFHAHITIERVTATDELNDHREALAEAFGLPGYVTEMLLPDIPPPTMRLYVAYMGGEAVGTASLFEAAGIGGLYNLGTHPSYRRRGIASALVRHVLDEACWECGLSDCVVQTSRTALPLFLGLGFERIAVCTRFVEPQHLPPGEGKKRN